MTAAGGTLPGMSDDDAQWWFSPSDGSVHQGKVKGVRDRMGPYPTRVAAEAALETAKARNAAADADDERNR